jgi:hypothetical protein
MHVTTIAATIAVIATDGQDTVFAVPLTTPLAVPAAGAGRTTPWTTTGTGPGTGTDTGAAGMTGSEGCTAPLTTMNWLVGEAGEVGEAENVEPAGTPEVSCARVQGTSRPFTRKNGPVLTEDELEGSLGCVNVFPY